jgi:lipopolysaccharide transport system ATP-binding protein
MDREIAVSVCDITKTYRLYQNRTDRVKETFHPLRKQYSRAFNALSHISLNVYKGETIGVIGRNGSGKSTLLQIICGILQPTSGGLAVNGRITALLELGAGFNPDFTGIENVYLNGSILGLSGKEIDDKLDAILAFADIGDFVHQPVKTYSSGMAVRLAFAVQANLDPEIFIVDEALAVGDAYFVHRCMLRFHDMQAQGKTIILVTHDGSAVKRLCHRAMWIDNGALQMIGEASPVVDCYLEDLFKKNIPKASEESALIPAADSSDAADDAASKESKLPPETVIPHVDKRLGDQLCSIVGVSLYDEQMRPIQSTEHDRTVILRMTIRNNALSEDLPLCAGYIFRDFRGIELASTHSMMEGVTIPKLSVGGSLTIRMKIELPTIYPGHYSFSPSISYVRNNEHIICDRPMNALVFEVTSNTEMHVMFRFKTHMEIEDR